MNVTFKDVQLPSVPSTTLLRLAYGMLFGMIVQCLAYFFTFSDKMLSYKAGEKLEG